MAWGRHKTRSEVTHCTRGASRQIAARAAAEKLMERTQRADREQELANSENTLASREGMSKENKIPIVGPAGLEPAARSL